MLWGYHDKGMANSVVLPLTPTSKGWTDVERRVDLKERLREAGRIRKFRFDWGWMSFYVLLVMAFFVSLGYGALLVLRHRTQDSEDMSKAKQESVEPAVEHENKAEVKLVSDSGVQSATYEPQPLLEVVTNLEVVDEMEINSVDESRHPAQELSTEHAGTGVAEVTPVMEIRQPMPESDSELRGKDVLGAEADTETGAASAQRHLEPNP